MKNAADDEYDEPEDNSAMSQRLEVQEVSVEQFNDLTKRLDSMESSVGLVLSKV